MNLKDYLDLFKLDKNYDEKILKVKYKELIEKSKPDNNAIDEEKLIEINDGYKYLSENLQNSCTKINDDEYEIYDDNAVIDSIFTNFSDFINIISKPPYDLDLVLNEIIDRKAPEFGSLSKKLPEVITKKLNFSDFYTHQVESIDNIRNGNDVLLITPTASGKTYSYLLPFIEKIYEDNNATGIFIYPLKALSNDQIKSFKHFNIGSCAKYDGNIDAQEKKKIRNNPPNALFTNPDTIHSSLLRTIDEWHGFLKNLKMIVVDEIHIYKGFFGSNVSNIFYRLLYAAKNQGANPQIVCCSATIDRAKEFAKKLTWKDYTEISSSGAGHSKKHILLIQHLTKGTFSIMSEMVENLYRNNKKIIIFCNSRLTVDTATNYIKASTKIDEISGYHAGYPEDERRDIENQLKNGDIKILITTSAMEMGIDIGGLDVCILYGIPNNNNEIWQRIGRVGRNYESDALIIVINTLSAIDKYFFNNPGEFLCTKDAPESPVIFPLNENIRKNHLLCGYYEGMKSDETLSGDFPLWIDIDKGTNKYNAYTGIAIRNSFGVNYDLIDENNKIIGQIEYSRIFKDLHYNAIFQNGSKKYKRMKINYNERKVYLKSVGRNERTITHPIIDSTVEIINIYEEKLRIYDTNDLIVGIGEVEVTKKVDSYLIKYDTGESKFSINNRYPDTLKFRTQAVWISFSNQTSELEKEIDGFSENSFSIFHSIEHLLLRNFIKRNHCDWNDFEGLTLRNHPNLARKPVIFFYDNCIEGVGLTERFYEELDSLLNDAYNTVTNCPCDNNSGCRACLLINKHCNLFNNNLDKINTIKFLNILRNNDYFEVNRTQHFSVEPESVNKNDYTIGDFYKGKWKVVQIDEDEIAIKTDTGIKYVPKN